MGDRRRRTAQEGLHPLHQLTTADRLGWTTQLQHAYLSSLSHNTVCTPTRDISPAKVLGMLLGVARAGLTHDTRLPVKLLSG